MLGPEDGRAVGTTVGRKDTEGWGLGFCDGSIDGKRDIVGVEL